MTPSHDAVFTMALQVAMTRISAGRYVNVPRRNDTHEAVRSVARLQLYGKAALDSPSMLVAAFGASIEWVPVCTVCAVVSAVRPYRPACGIPKSGPCTDGGLCVA